MNRYVLSYTSKIEHLRTGMLTPNEFIVFDALIHAAGWHPERPDYARVTKNVSQLHRALFRDEETGYEVWTRQGVSKLIKSLLSKGYLLEEPGWFFLPSYEKWQRHGGEAQRTLASKAKKSATPVAPLVKGAQESATPVADSLVDQTQEIATPVAGVQPRLQEGATPVAKIATPVAGGATPVADHVAETRATSASPDPSFMIHSTFTSPSTPLTPQGGEAGAGEEEKLLSELEEFFTQQLQVPHLGASDFRHIRSFIERKIPLALIRQVVADAKRGYRPKFPGDRIKHVGFFVREIETRLATPSSPAPTGVALPPSLTAEDVARDERLSRKLEDLRKELRTALTHRRSESDPRFIAAIRGIQQKASNNDLPWALIVAGTDLEGSVA